MRARYLKFLRGDQQGFALIEVLMSAVVLLIVSAGFVTAFVVTSRSTATERHRARANDLAEQELERVRSLRIGDLGHPTSGPGSKSKPEGIVTL